MTTITEDATYEVITEDQVHAEAFGIRYRGISPVQAAKIEKIHARTKARVRDMSDRVSTEDQKPAARTGRVSMSFGEFLASGGSGRTVSKSEFTHDSEALVAEAKYEIEKIAAKAPGLVRERIIPSFNFAPSSEPNPVDA